ncbi:hypothetical protein SAMN04488543_0320 [Friedmanniella luteola]|uniref:FG-GAP repeat-containing protein n=1 Tax=Friedmanniella luteola TaxID=546871 RepID=A0A1H1LKW8_9ACTN|nr:hypothetical protein [Friedmanniella luteola]SDR74952.1 hypothetical protein SAMN04488543_0320 [Friedmanniella luteola]
MVDEDRVAAGRPRRRGPALVAVLLAPLLLGPLGPLVLPAGAATACSPGAPTDVDGGGPDVVLGLPSFDLPGKPDAGALVVFSDLAGPGESDPRGATRRTVVTAADVGLPTQAGARFGAAVVVVRRLGTCAALVVGAPGEDVAGRRGAGRVHVLPGSPQGLGSPLESLDESLLPGLGGAQAGAGFGSAVVADGADWMAVGVPGRDLGGAVDAGRVVRVDRREPTGQRVDVVQQGGRGAGTPERGDRFGEVLEVAPSGVGPLLLVGVPREDVGTRGDAGAVAFQAGDRPLSMVTQDSPGAGGTAEAGDRFGAALDSWATPAGDHVALMAAVGVPGEDLGRTVDAGLVGYVAVDLFDTSDTSVGPLEGRSLTVSQDSRGVPGVVERDDRFGAAVLTGEFGVDAGRLHLVVGSPGEDVGRTADAGQVTLTGIRITDGTPLSAFGGGWTQDTPGVRGVPERGDGFGSALAGVQLARAEDDEDSVHVVVLVTVPGEDDGTTSGTGMAHLGLPGGGGSVPLVPPARQAGAGTGMRAVDGRLG